MANLYQCKCGAPLEVSADGKTGICPFCGATVVFPKAGFQRMNKANEMRLRREFDQAEGIYRSLTIAFPDDPEIWWNIVLCEYGIEYVKEVKDGVEKMIPTINRMKYESIFELDAYKKALEFSDVETKAIYQAEAQKIEDIQKRLQEIVAKEEKYDIFISFKDKDDETGERTLDSALAQEIYDALTKEGYKVFFSRITLRRMVGQEFEPKIFAALNSAAMMIVVGCKKEHVEATWVKNEWSRYLKLMEKDADKYLLPVYADMKADDLPAKLAPMEGIEANGVNYMKLILKNVGERIGYKKEQRVNEKIVHDVAILEQDEVRRITERGYNAIKSGRMDQADDYFEQALDINVGYAPAWWGKLSILTDDFEDNCDIFANPEMNRYYNEAMKLATEEQKAGFERDMERYRRKQDEYLGESLLATFMSRTNNMHRVFCDGTPEEDAIHAELVEMQGKILSLVDKKKAEELKPQFEEYNRKQGRVKLLKAEYLAIEAENQRMYDKLTQMTNTINNHTDTLRRSKEGLKLKRYIVLLAIIVPNTIALWFEPTAENMWILYALIVLCVYKIWKKIKTRNKICGGSYSGLKKAIDREVAEKVDMLQITTERANQLPTIYNDLRQKYIDVKGFVIPKDINAHVAEWTKKLAVRRKG